MAAIPRQAALAGNLLRACGRPIRSASRPIVASSMGARAPRSVAMATATHLRHGQPLRTTCAGVRWYSKQREMDDKADAEAGIESYTYEDMVNSIAKRKQGQWIIDVREPTELFETGKIPTAINIPITSAVQSFHVSPEDFEDMFGYARPGKGEKLIFYCKAGIRARSAAQLAQHAGFHRVAVYKGSWLDWDKQGGRVTKVLPNAVQFVPKTEHEHISWPREVSAEHPSEKARPDEFVDDFQDSEIKEIKAQSEAEVKKKQSQKSWTKALKKAEEAKTGTDDSAKQP